MIVEIIHLCIYTKFEKLLVTNIKTQKKFYIKILIKALVSTKNKRGEQEIRGR